MLVNLTEAEILEALQNGSGGQLFSLGTSQFTFSIPGAMSSWPSPDYTPGTGRGHEPFDGAFILNSIQADDFRTAIMVWDELIPNDFSENNEAIDGAGEVRVAFTNIADTGTAGYAYTAPPQAPGTKTGDIWLNNANAGESFAQGTSNFETYIHEIGHVLGLRHTFLDGDDPPGTIIIDPIYDSTTYSIMSYDRPQGATFTFNVMDTGGGGFSFGGSFGTEGTGVATTPMVVDIAAVQGIYGVETTTRAGDTVYTYAETDLSIRTIFDSGGTDTLDLSSYTRQNIIDLRPGAYSSIGYFPEADQRAFWKAMFVLPPAVATAFNAFIDDTYDTYDDPSGDPLNPNPLEGVPVYENENNLGIAFSTVIENAFGGSNTDDILGNDANNELRGNGGNDTLQGGKGNDTLKGGDDDDIAVYSGNRGDYLAEVSGMGFRLTDQRGGDENEGVDETDGIETYRFADGDVLAANLVGANLDPVATDDTVAAAAGGDVTFDPKDNDTDPEMDTLTITAVGNETSGTAVLNGNNTVTYTAANGFSGQATFTYTLSDNNGGFDTGTVTVNVTASNDPPDAVDDSAVVDEDSSVAVNVLTNDSDPDTDPLTVTSFSQGMNGAVSDLGGGQLQYMPVGNFNGTDSFTYTISDGNGGSDTATVSVTINPVNDAPDAVDDEVGMLEDKAPALQVLNNDSDPDGDPLTVSVLVSPIHGTTEVLLNQTIRYTPPLNYVGTDEFVYQVDDGNGGTDTATVSINVEAQNDDPVAVDDNLPGLFDQPTSIPFSQLTANDSDVDGDSLTVASAGVATNGTVGIVNDNVVFTPTAGFSGTATFQYTLSDNNGGFGVGNVTLTIAATNQPPDAVNDVINVDEDTIAIIDVLANDTDPDGDGLFASILVQPAHGTIGFLGDGFTYTPDANFNGTDSFSYTVDDLNGGTDTATVTINIAPVNDIPVAADDAAAVDEDSSVTIDVLANDSDIDGDSLNITGSPSANNGTAAIVSNQILYTPDPDFNGTDTVVYRVSDGSRIALGTVTITVNPVNDAPLPVDDTAQTDQDMAVTIDVLANDSDPDGDIFSLTTLFNGANGTTAFNGATQDVTYTPNAGFTGTDTFSYFIQDSEGANNFAVVTVTVSAPGNNAPVAVDDTFEGAEGRTEVFQFADLTGNDSDPDGDPLTIIDLLNQVGGTTQLAGAIAFIPTPGFTGEAGFDYVLSDGNGGTDIGHVTINIPPANLPPVAVDDTASLDEDTGPVSISVLTNDSDPDGDALTVTGSTAASNGSVTDNGGGSFEYTPVADFSGTDTFTYTVSDGNGETSVATVTITVNPVNDAPVAVADTVVVDEGGDATVVVLANDTDIDGDTLIVTGASANPAQVSLRINPDDSITVSPVGDFNGTTTFTYLLSDGQGGNDTGTVTVTVNPVNDPPVAIDDDIVAGIDTARTIDAGTLLANDTDVDGDALTITGVNSPSNGTVELDGSTIVFTPNTGFSGDASFRYSISDGNGGASTATVNVAVSAANQPPDIAATRAVTTLTGTAISLDITASDPNGDMLSYSVSDPAGGTAMIDGSTVLYTPDGGTTGTDPFTLTVDDGNGGTAQQVVTVTIASLAVADNFNLFVSDAFAGGVGGTGSVFGTQAAQDITVIDEPGIVRLDPSFNRGGDVLRLSGDAADWFIGRTGSSAVFNDGDTFVLAPVGSAGLAVAFDDGVRELKFDDALQSFTIGGQAFAGAIEQITALADGTPLPTGTDPAAKGVLFMAADGSVSASGRIDIFGTSGSELANLISGNLTLDPSFNRGGDTIVFDDPASDFVAVRVGSSVQLDGLDTQALIPVGSAGATLSFAGGDDRAIVFDSGVFIGAQLIGFDPVQLTAAV